MTANTLRQSNNARLSLWLMRGLYAVIALIVVIVLGFNIWQPIKVLPRIRLAPGFVFTNQAGAHKTSEDYRGKFTLYSFTYARCGETCAPTYTQLQTLRQQLAALGADNLKFALVTISLDPEHDTPATLSELAAQYPAAQNSAVTWDWLVGDATRTKYVVGDGFNTFYDQSGGAIQFDPRFVLVDGWGITRAEYRTLDANRVVRDVNYLITEVRNSDGVGRFAYEAAHLFQCYP